MDMNRPERYLITSALPYANGPLHIGHLSGAYLSADIYVRFLRLMGKDVLYVCGSDEHGAAITMRAQKEGISPREIIDKYHAQFKEIFEKMRISFDEYYRTSSELHHKTTQEFFIDLYEKGVFEKKTSEQYYDEKAGQFLADRYITGECPKCGFAEAYGDQCENCGTSLSPTELINPQSTLTASEPVLKETTHWYLPLNNEEEWLREWIEKGTLEGEFHHDPAQWKPHVIGQCKSWIDNGLQPRSMTRDLDWGVDVPQEIEGSAGKKMYVWLDAPIGYISATKAYADENNIDWRKYWQDEKSALIHFIGKDNIVFHCIIFPALLKAHGDYNLPINVPANQFMNLEGKKISTSRDWAVWVKDYVEEFPMLIDELRYSLTRKMPENRDSDFTWEGFQEHINSELVNTLGNFINRVLVLTNKYYGGKVPEYDPDEMITSASSQEEESFHDAELIDLFDLIHEACRAIREFDLRGGLKAFMNIASRGNQLLQFNEPWKIKKEEPEQVKVVMNLGIQYVAALALCMWPFMPGKSDELQAMLSLPTIKGTGELDDFLMKLAEGEMPVPAGHTIEKAEHLFSRIDDDLIRTQIEKLNTRLKSEEKSTTMDYKVEKKEIEYGDFTKMDLRSGLILSSEPVKNADRLLKLEVDLGYEKRTIVSGIAEQFSPDEIIGKKVSVLVNLQPKKLRGVVSQGMILMTEDQEGKLYFVNPGEVDPGMPIN